MEKRKIDLNAIIHQKSCTDLGEIAIFKEKDMNTDSIGQHEKSKIPQQAQKTTEFTKEQAQIQKIFFQLDRIQKDFEI